MHRSPPSAHTNSVLALNRTPQRHPLYKHFGSRPNRTPMSMYSIPTSVLARSETTSVLARSELPVLSAGGSGVPLQAGLAPGNSLHDFPVSPADITQNRCTGPARAGRLHPHVGHSNYAGVSAVPSGPQTHEIELISRIR